MGRSSKSLSIETGIILKMENLGDLFETGVHRQFEAAALAWIERQETGEWPDFDELLKKVKQP